MIAAVCVCMCKESYILVCHTNKKPPQNLIYSKIWIETELTIHTIIHIITRNNKWSSTENMHCKYVRSESQFSLSLAAN